LGRAQRLTRPARTPQDTKRKTHWKVELILPSLPRSRSRQRQRPWLEAAETPECDCDDRRQLDPLCEFG